MYPLAWANASARRLKPSQTASHAQPRLDRSRDDKQQANKRQEIFVGHLSEDVAFREQ